MIPTPPIMTATHEVLNQAHALENYNAYANNRPLQEAVAQQGAGWAQDWLMARGAEVGSAEWIEHGRLANVNPPVLKLFDRYGNRRDEVDFHPSWHECLGWLKRHGCDTGPWAEPKPGAHVARAAAYVMFAEIECGSLCPTTMTYGAVPVLRHVPEIARDWMPKLLSRDYDQALHPATQKKGVLIGMGLTEKQGGSDVRANTTRAEPNGDGTWRITGHKWFLSAPMCDAFLVTAQTAKGCPASSCRAGRRTGGSTKCASSASRTRWATAPTPAPRWSSGARWAGWSARKGAASPPCWRWASTRASIAPSAAPASCAPRCRRPCTTPPARRLRQAAADQPLMMNVLADMALEVEAATALSLRLARAFDAQEDEAESLLRRILTPVAKYWICKRCPTLVAEAMEVHGGNGYVEEGPMPRLFRQSPLNSIWEGSGNVMCLDTLRAMARHPKSAEVLPPRSRRRWARTAAFDAFVGATAEGRCATPTGHRDARARA
jgi:putative acyl-CoA dehydrogenase